MFKTVFSLSGLVMSKCVMANWIPSYVDIQPTRHDRFNPTYWLYENSLRQVAGDQMS